MSIWKRSKEFKRLVGVKSWFEYFRNTPRQWMKWDIQLYKLYRLGKKKK